MSNLYYDLFISKFIVSNRKERLKYEIDSKKRKKDFINHFCHDTLKYINIKRIIFEGQPHDFFNRFQIRNREMFFVVSELYDDGKMMTVDELKLYIDNEYMSIVAISNSIAIIKEETEFNSHIYVLQ